MQLSTVTVRSRVRPILAGFLATVLGGGAVLAVTTTPAAAAEVSPTPSSGVWTVDGHGNGHGHGLSQFGARGAAIAGLSYSRILAFYYPGTTLTALPPANIRVELTTAGAYTTVAVQPGLSLTGLGVLPTAGVSQYRLVPITGGFQVQRLVATGWAAYRNLPSTWLTFTASSGTVTLEGSAGPKAYRGAISSVKSGTSTYTVNTLGLDAYVQGVVPSEMPASWQSAAVQSQAVAARTYARYYVTHPRSAAYDICDNTNCQMYGGLSAEQAASNLAVSQTSNQVLTYGGSIAFTEFSASNGGVTSGGGQPYFVTKVDPYDDAASGDWYLNWTQTVAASTVANYYGLGKVTELEITGRAGGGEWGGIVTSAIVVGATASGTPTSISVSGPDLASAMGLPYSYFHIRPVPAIGHLDSATMTKLHTVTVSGWAMDRSNGGASDTVALLVDSTKTILTAKLPRPDVQAVYHSGSPNHGFVASLGVPGGTHNVCAYAITLAGTDQTLIGCRTVVVPVSPLGHVERITTDGKGNYRLQGWTFDPDSNGGPSRVHVYVGPAGYSLPAGLARPDVQRYFGLANNLVGFDVTVPVPTGTHGLCAYGINTAPSPGANVSLGCWTVTR